MRQGECTLDWDKVDLVVFDVDGTLYRQRSLRLRMLAALLAEGLRTRSFSVLRTLRAYRRCREELGTAEGEGFGERQFALTGRRVGLPPDKVRALVAEWMETRPLGHLSRCREAEVAALFDGLRAAGKRIAVFSDYPATDKLQALDLRADWVVSAGDPDVPRLKPDPSGLLKILRLAGVPPERALMIGDRFDRDWEAARRANVPALIKSSRARPGAATFRSYRGPPFSQFIARQGEAEGGSGLPRKAALYLVAGGAAALTDLGVFGLALAAGAGTAAGATISFLVAALVNYLLSSVIVFGKPLSLGRGAAFLAGATVGLCVNVSITWTLAHQFEVPALLAKTVAIALALVVNFSLNAFLVFRESAPARASSRTRDRADRPFAAEPAKPAA